MKFEPQKDYMIIERLDIPKGLILPGNSEPTADTIFKVIQVGPGEDDVKPVIKKGDVISINGYLITVDYKGKKIVMARARDVILKIVED